MPYQDPRLNFTSLALTQLHRLSLNRQNLVSFLLRELVEMQDCGADHGTNYNPFMEGCSLFAMHSKSLTKWGVKITYGICQDKIDIVCIEVDPSPLPPSGPQAISIRSFSANDNYEFIRHPVTEFHFAFGDLEKIAAWLLSAQRNYFEPLTHGMTVKKSFTMTMLMDLSGVYNAELLKENYRIKSCIELDSSNLERCASRILLNTHSIAAADYISSVSAITMSSILVGLTMADYDTSVWQKGAILRVNSLGSLEYQSQSFALCDQNVNFIVPSNGDQMFTPCNRDVLDLEHPLYSFDLFKEDDLFSDRELGVFSFRAIIAPFDQPPCHLH